LLKDSRDVSFEDVKHAIDEGDLIKLIDNPNKKKYAHQQMFIVKISTYVYLVPFVEDEEKVFLKTIIPSRKMTKKYLIEGREKEK
jgi:hypothetical protein